MTHLRELAGVGDDAPDRAARLRAFCRRFAEGAFRRPLTPEQERLFIERQFAALIEEARRTGAEATFTEDWKSALQEWLQSHGRGLPIYRLIEEIGPPHRRTFVIEVQVEGDAIARAEGRSKKEGAQAAAKAALEALSSD